MRQFSRSLVGWSADAGSASVSPCLRGCIFFGCGYAALCVFVPSW